MKRDAGSRKIKRMNSSTLNREYSYNTNGKSNDGTGKHQHTTITQWHEMRARNEHNNQQP